MMGRLFYSVCFAILCGWMGTVMANPVIIVRCLQKKLKEDLIDPKEFSVLQVVLALFCGIFYFVFGYFFVNTESVIPYVIIALFQLMVQIPLTSIVTIKADCLKKEGLNYLMFYISLAMSLIFGFAWANISNFYEKSYSENIAAKMQLLEGTSPNIDEDLLQRINDSLDRNLEISEKLTRNGKTVLVVSNKKFDSIKGYILVENNQFTFVESVVKYAPDFLNGYEMEKCSKEILPNKVFGKDWIFQIAPNGDICFVSFYAEEKNAFPDEVLGIVAVNSTTGQATAYTWDEIPEWMG